MNARNKMPAGAALTAFDAADYLHTREEIDAFLDIVFETCDGDDRVIAKAQDAAARARKRL